MRTVSRRAVLGGMMCGCVTCGTRAAGHVAPAALQSLVTPDYKPVDADEKGLWQQWERLEEELASSNLLIDAPAMKAYSVGVTERLLGEQARPVRVYLVHDPDFNASMAPNGMMLVQSGLLARVRSEAQFAAVLGHESGHYLRRHSVERWRDRKRKTGAMAFVSAGSSVLAGATAMAGGDGGGWIDLANSINGSLAASIFSFSRDQESEADAYGMKLMDQAGYSPDAASQMWRQVIEERRASAAARGKRYRDSGRSAFSTHPPSDERMLDLATQAREIDTITVTARRPHEEGRAAWQAAIAPLRASLLDEQIKLNDPGASLYLVEALATDGWDGTLRYFEGETYRLRDAPGDTARAAEAYARAVALPDAPPEAWRANGYALLKAGRGEDGKHALARYLELAPTANDAAMVRFALAQ